jgi:hypothetical protein
VQDAAIKCEDRKFGEADSPGKENLKCWIQDSDAMLVVIWEMQSVPTSKCYIKGWLTVGMKCKHAPRFGTKGLFSKHFFFAANVCLFYPVFKLFNV